MLKKRIERVANRIDIHSLEVIQKSSASLIVKMSGIIIAIGVSILLGRNLGVEGYGTIELANRIVALLLMLSIFGMPNVILKEISISYENKNWQIIKNTLCTSLLFTGSLSLLLSGSFYLAAPFLSINFFDNENLQLPLQISLIAMLFQTTSRSFASGINGLGRVWQSNLVDQALSMFVVFVGIFTIQLLGFKITVINAALMFGLGRLIVSISMGIYWRKIFPYKSNKFEFRKALINPASHLLLASASGIIALNANSVMLGAMSDFREVGLYNAAVRIAMVLSLILQVVNTAISPKFAVLIYSHKKMELQELYNRITLGLIVLGMFLLLLFIMGGRFMLSLWGDDFMEAYYILIILAMGQFINISTGGVGSMLMMAGKEKIVGRLASINLGFNIILNFVFIFFFGAIGAAFATAISVSIINMMRCYMVQKHIGIKANPLSIVLNFIIRKNK